MPAMVASAIPEYSLDISIAITPSVAMRAATRLKRHKEINMQPSVRNDQKLACPANNPHTSTAIGTHP
ncbi:hypothetical protein [Verminephrobacter aporrectodeae]|uniref:hypothetical protein n=1 Tax=Verminephrobacter aporrectodeae TaxID=1110389 RepID=UPI0022383522|nr:hypothetical protein [Verminephrobacter aporrectodeae]